MLIYEATDDCREQYTTQIATFTPEQRQRVIESAVYVPRRLDWLDDALYFDPETAGLYHAEYGELAYEIEIFREKYVHEVSMLDPHDDMFEKCLQNLHDGFLENLRGRTPEKYFARVQHDMLQFVVDLATREDGIMSHYGLDPEPQITDIQFAPEVAEYSDEYVSRMSELHRLRGEEVYEAMDAESMAFRNRLFCLGIEPVHIAEVHHAPHQYIDFVLDYRRYDYSGEGKRLPIERRRMRLDPKQTAYTEAALRAGTITAEQLLDGHFVGLDGVSAKAHIMTPARRGHLEQQHTITNSWDERQQQIREELHTLATDPDYAPGIELRSSTALYLVDTNGKIVEDTNPDITPQQRWMSDKHYDRAGQYPALAQHVYQHPGALDEINNLLTGDHDIPLQWRLYHPEFALTNRDHETPLRYKWET